MPSVSDEQWRLLLASARRQFVYDLIMGSIYHAREIWERMELLGITSVPRLVLSLRMENYYALTYDKSERWKYIFKEDVLQYLRQLVPEDVLFVPYTDNIIVLLAPFASLHEDNEREQIHDTLRGWAQILFESTGLTVSFGIGCVYNDPRLLHFSFQESLQALNSVRENGITFADCVGEGLRPRSVSIPSETEGDLSKPAWPEDAAKTVSRRLAQGDYAGVIVQLQAGLERGVIATFSGQEEIPSEDKMVVALELALAVLKETFPNSRRELVLQTVPLLFQSSAVHERPDPQTWLTTFGEKLIQWAEHYGPRENPRVAYIKGYVHDHLDGDLTLTSVAKVVHLAPAYLSQLFKKVTGESFSDYVSGQRLGKACQLLQGTSLSVREIARRVGFQDVNYFTRAFKQRFQKTPGEFRKRQS